MDSERNRYLGAIPRDDPRAHLGVRLPTGPISVPGPDELARRQRALAEQAVAEEWLAETIRTGLLERVGHGPRHQGSFLPLGGVPAWVDEEPFELNFSVRMGEHAFVVAVRRL